MTGTTVGTCPWTISTQRLARQSNIQQCCNVHLLQPTRRRFRRCCKKRSEQRMPFRDDEPRHTSVVASSTMVQPLIRSVSFYVLVPMKESRVGFQPHKSLSGSLLYQLVDCKGSAASKQCQIIIVGNSCPKLCCPKHGKQTTESSPNRGTPESRGCVSFCKKSKWQSCQMLYKVNS